MYEEGPTEEQGVEITKVFDLSSIGGNSKKKPGGDDDADEKNNKDKLGPLSPASAVFLAFGRTEKIVLFRWLGALSAVVSGSVYPVMAFYFSQSFEKLGASTDGDNFMNEIKDLAMAFLVLGAAGFVSLVAQSFFLEIAASESTMDFKIQWFHALLRQDMAYFDIKDVSSQATVVSSCAAKYKM
jgi:ABC transporter transmembrane region.